MDAPTVTLGGHTATLAKPSPLAALALGRTQQQLEVGGAGTALALGAAALAMCWPKGTTWPTRPKPRAWKPGQRAEDYGHGVFDALFEQSGTDSVALMEACVDALLWSTSTLATVEEVAAAEDFSEPPSGG